MLEMVLPMTTKAIKILVIEFVIFEMIFQLLPECTNYDLIHNHIFSGTYEFVISHQWDKATVDRMGTYLSENAVDDFTGLPDPVIVPAMVLIPAGVILGLIGVALYLNFKYIAIFIVVDLILYIIRRDI